ncbi:MAG TPA: hypothetical protein VEJ63_18475 [Planctomycetota bacterium]|nr:hypothetical protein [Planctomycetota bacterium]
MPNMLVLYDIPSFAEEKWEEGMSGMGWKKVGRGTWLKSVPQSDVAVQEVTKAFQPLDLELSEEDDEHVWLVYAGRDQAGNPQLGVKTLFGKKPG